jgi:hypothetical protein
MLATEPAPADNTLSSAVPAPAAPQSVALLDSSTAAIGGSAPSPWAETPSGGPAPAASVDPLLADAGTLSNEVTSAPAPPEDPSLAGQY